MKKIFYIVLLLIIAALLFQYTVEIRKPWFGDLSPWHHQWNSGVALVHIKNWYAEGLIPLKFGLIENPKSVEFNDLSSRQPYPSFPPGAQLPLYIISIIRGEEPTVSLVMSYNLLIHFLMAFLLALTVYIFLLQLEFRPSVAFTFSIIPIMLELLLPAPLYWHQNVYFADQAVLIPFILLILLEIVRDGIESRRALAAVGACQAILLFCGTLTDWLFIFIALTVYIKRVLTGEITLPFKTFCKKSTGFWLPSVLALSLFTFQLYSLKVLSRIADRFLKRTALDPAMSEISEINEGFFTLFWFEHIRTGYGRIAVSLILGSFIVFCITLIYLISQHFRKKQVNPSITKIVSLIGMLLVPCLLQVHVLSQHSAVHDFSTLKFSIPLTIVPFILVPVLICSFFGLNIGNFSFSGLRKISSDYASNMKSLVIMIFIIAFVIVYVAYMHPRFGHLFPYVDRSYRSIGEFISGNTVYRDVVFSPNHEIPMYPPQKLSYSMKRVYKIHSLEDIYNKVKTIQEDFKINLLLVGDDDSDNPDIEMLIAAAYEVKRSDNMYLSLYKIYPHEFFKLVHRFHMNKLDLE